MQILYKAIDGKIFDNEDECLLYENKNNYSDLKNIEFYSEDGTKCYIDLNDIYNDNIYQFAEKVIIHNQNEFKCFIWLAEECGWCEFYDQITSPGTWVRLKEGLQGIWTKEKEIKGE